MNSFEHHTSERLRIIGSLKQAVSSALNLAWDRSVSIGSLADKHMDRRLNRPKPDRGGCFTFP